MSRFLKNITLEQKVTELVAENQQLQKNLATLRNDLDRHSLREGQSLSPEFKARALLNATVEAAALFDPLGTILECNHVFAERYHREPEELINVILWELMAPDLAKTRKAKFDEVLKTGKWVRFQDQRDTLIRDNSFYPVFDIDGRTVGVALFSMDLTLRLETEKALRISEEKYRELVQNANSIVLRRDSLGQVTFFNEYAQKFFGFTEEEILGQNVIGTIVPEKESTGRDLKEMVREISRNPEVYASNENENIRRNGERVWVSWTNKAIRHDAQGRVTEILCVGNDVTQRKEAEKALRQSEEKHRAILENMEEGYYESDIPGNLTFFNDSLCRIFGYSRAELQGMNNRQLSLPEIAKKNFEKFNQVYRTGEPISLTEFEILRKDGQRRTLEVSVALIRDLTDRPTGFRGIVRDVTERIKAEQDLRESQERYRAMVEDMPAMICRFLPDGRLTFANQNYCTYFNKREGELPGQVFFEFITEADRETVRDQLNSLSPENPMITSFYQVIAPDGQRRTLEWANRALFNQQGHLTEYQSIGRDITEFKQSLEEKARIEKQLLQGQKMEALGALAGGIAHDFNNILTAIMGYAELLELVLPPEKTNIRNYVTEMLKGSHRAKELVKQILTFSRASEQERKPILLSLMIKETLKFLRASLPVSIDIQQVIQPETQPILADATQMHQVLMNLCTNAAHAMGDKGGVLKVTLDEVELDEQTASSYPPLEPGDYIRLTVGDNGHGMSPEVMERIFDPYFTTKDKGEGTGLGLAVVHGIVKNHGGAIAVESISGQGTTFQLFFPLIKGEKGEFKSGDLPPIPGGKERILLIDDEKAIVEIGKTTLELLGYRVEGKTNSREALDFFTRQPHTIDLVITDMTMPYMLGIDLARECLKIRPGMPIILCTGFNESITAEKARALGVKEFITKPFDSRLMARTVRKVLDGMDNQNYLDGSPDIIKE